MAKARKAAAAPAPSKQDQLTKALEAYDAAAQLQIDARKALETAAADMLRLAPNDQRVALRLDPNALVGTPKCSADAAAINARQAAKA